VLGTAAFSRKTEEHSRALLDAFVDLGGNVVDCARQYGEPNWGESEEVVGRWLADRKPAGFVVLTKGAHHREDGRRRVTPDAITEDLLLSLAALGSGSIDLYLLHRDDPSQPVGPLLDCLNEHLRAGRIGAFGASNWRPARLEQAAAHARAHDLEGFACSSPGLSLAVENEPAWWESVSAHDTASLAWYERTQTPAFAWSALAGGFFAGAVGPEVERVYDSQPNRERRRRARELARAKGATAGQVALAWVLHRPFPVYAIIGPRTVEELRESVAAVDLPVTPEELRRLDLEEGA
jgi:1-deoxyxylulose-5-phosphate synthase